MQLTSWKEKGLSWGNSKELTGLQSCIQNMVDKKLKLVNIVQVMLIHLILPCQQRAFNLWEFDPARHRTLSRLFDTTFIAPAVDFAPAHGGDTYVRLDPALGLFNKFRVEAPARPAAFFRAEPAVAVKNHLVFMHSGRGNHYYLGDRNRIAIYQPEADLYTDQQDMTGIGRFLPSLKTVKVTSDALGQTFSLRISNAALRTLDYKGGLDAFIVKARDELEADRLGVDYMAGAGFKPSEAVALWRLMAAQRQASIPQFASTHPSDATRIDLLQQYIAGKGWS